MSKLKKKSLSSQPSAPRGDALEGALRFLSYRPRSAAEVHNYLISRGYSAAAAAETLAKLHSLSYLNDELFARNWAASKFTSRSYGPKRIEQELRSKGISEALIRDVLRETCDPGCEADKARSLLAKKFDSQDLADPKIVRRAVGFLQRRGYSSEVVFALLKYPAQDD
ncbi:MAG TPA: regulatory protein RecX [Candidatus Binatia bacterium]